MELVVFDVKGKETSKKVNLNDEIFAITPNTHAIYLDVKQYLANQRQGTHKSKERAEISGSTVKIKRQKGTGTARAGSIKSPIFRGGGRVFGPRPRNYGFKLNTKLKQLARKSALAIKAGKEAINVVEDLQLDAPKTKSMVQMTKSFGVEGKRVLYVTADIDKNVYLSSRNLQNVQVVNVNDLATYDIMKASAVFFSESSVEGLDKLFKL
ncbi:LSU ribosomal protein L4P [Balneicella halophila]|uniref:Large ribosomal subunit protein uL4 n=1 Tax=Balneicella halophila TaxID=1537566 RepID=A0A7L4USC7_BALHA|nr:50S ribosomal protein L4 [Balneicella halophila]PVX52392.1 LSU ribosomal protein L4P [Balneicella halophila]